MEMKKYKLGDIAKVEISNVDKKTKENETEVLLCNFTNVYRNWNITKDCESQFMKATANKNEIAKFSIRKGQVALTKDSETRDDIGVPTYIACDFDNVLLGYHCALITPDEKVLDGSYLNCLLNAKTYQRYFENNSCGSGQRFTLSLETLNNIPLSLPSLLTQSRIAKIFSAIDSKIALNKKICAELEAMAKEIYDYWFVQFDFPNEEGNPYKASGGKMEANCELGMKNYELPMGWKVKKIGEILDSVPKTKKFQTDEFLDYGEIPIIDQGEKFIAGYTNDKKNTIEKIPAIVFGDHSCKVKMINFPFARGGDGTQIMYSKIENIKPYYLYFYVLKLPITTGYARHYSLLKNMPIIFLIKLLLKNLIMWLKKYFQELR